MKKGVAEAKDCAAVKMKEIGIKELLRISSIMGIKQIKNITRTYCINPTIIITRQAEKSEVIDCGKGLNLEKSFYSALFESIERYSAAAYGDIYCESSVKQLSGKSLLKPSDFFPQKRNRDNVKRKWCKGRDILNQSEILVSIRVV